jgi:hypothetical protein
MWRKLTSSEDESCVLLQGAFAILLQAFIGIGALCSLVYKRYFVEVEPRRPFQIWVMDVTKQIVQSMFVHFGNIGLAIMISDWALSEEKSHDECAFYFISFALDTFIGVAIIWAVLRGSSYLAVQYDLPPLKHHGYYGEPPQVDWYMIQLGVFILATVISKCILATYMFFMSNWLDTFGDSLFGPIQGDPDAELLLVMVICPFFMSVIQYWVVDTFLMDKANASRNSYSYLLDDDDGMSILSNISKGTSWSARRDESFFRPI